MESMDIQNSEDPIDVIELVRSLQRREGNPDCFRGKKGQCDEIDCVYRQWCLIDRPISGREGNHL